MKKYLLTAEPPKSSSFLELIDYSIKNAVCHIFRSYRYVFDSLESYYLERGKIEEGSLTLIQVPDLVSDEGLILKKDLKYWEKFFNNNEIPNYINSGGTIGEFIILIPVNSLIFEEKNGLKVDLLKETIKYAKSNDISSYASEYIKKKYGVI